MDFNEITLKINTEDLEIASAIANMTVPYGIYIEDYSDLETEAVAIAHIDLIDEELLERDKTTALIHIYLPLEESPLEAISFLEERLKAEKIGYEITTGEVFSKDYLNNWKKYFKKKEIGEKLLILPSWEQEENTSRKILKIDPGAAFGRGTHATTSMCLELLDKYVKSNMEILDIGCGSGILSVASALLGAKKALGVDIDATAVKVSKETAELNGVTANTEFFVGDAIKEVDGKFDIIVANIVADVIIYLSDKIKPLLKENGMFICSGIISGREDEVKNALIKNGFTITEFCNIDNWYAFGGSYDRA